jgi:hypothetical protein
LSLPAEPVLVNFANAGPLLGASERAGSLPAHFVRTWPLVVVAWAAQALGHFPRPVMGHLAQPLLGHPVRARPVLAHLSRPPTLGIASTGLRLMAH